MNIQTRDSETVLIGFAETARRLGITERTLHRAVAQELLRPVRLQGIRRVLFDVRDIESLIEEGKAAAQK